jgi:hypothetical protein
LRSAVGAPRYAEGDSLEDISFDWDVELVHARLKSSLDAHQDSVIHTHFDTLFDLKDRPETRHFAGTIVYRKRLTWDPIVSGTTLGDRREPTDAPGATLLDLGLVEGVSEVFVNGQSAGVRYYGRRQYDISDLLHEGDNELEIRVTTTLGNYLKTFTKEDNPTAWIYVNHPKRDQPLQPMGMIGPVTYY